jgi:hypothetical protein
MQSKKLKREKIMTDTIKRRWITKMPYRMIDQILAVKAANPQKDTSRLEERIDKMVYALYGLTEEEVRVVEGKE